MTIPFITKATFDQGSPIFRIKDNAPVIYGVYFGDCTAGSLDRAVSGSCGARITKKVFLDFCRHSLNENVQLPGCDNKILTQSMCKESEFFVNFCSKAGHKISSN